MVDIIEEFNNLVPFINRLESEGRKIQEFCNNLEGFGFYIEAYNKHYIEIRVFGIGIFVSILKHNSNASHDTLNDIRIKKSTCIENYIEVEPIVEKYLKETKNLTKTYSIELTENELLELIKISPEKLKEKLKKVFTN